MDPEAKKATRWMSIVLGMPVIIIGIVLLIMHTRSWDKKPPVAGTNIIAFGDSLVEGVGATEGNDWVSLVSRELNIEIINAGRSGDTTAMALERLGKDVLKNDPKMVIVLLGGNDALRRIPRAQTFANLAQVIDQIQAQGASVFLIGIQGGLIGDSYKDDFKKLAREKGTWLVPDILDGIFGDPRLMSDPIHPNDVGYARVADQIAPELQEIIENKG